MTEYLQGIDISKHQGLVDHQEVAASGMLFCICKATEGRNYEDPQFEQNVKSIRAVLEDGFDYYPGAYHFARPDSDGGGAADGLADGVRAGTVSVVRAGDAMSRRPCVAARCDRVGR